MEKAMMHAMTEYTYERCGALVYIHAHGRKQAYTKSGVQSALDNVRKSRDDYVTEEAWTEHLKKFQTALAMFD